MGKISGQATPKAIPWALPTLRVFSPYQSLAGLLLLRLSANPGTHGQPARRLAGVHRVLSIGQTGEHPNVLATLIIKGFCGRHTRSRSADDLLAVEGRYCWPWLLLRRLNNRRSNNISFYAVSPAPCGATAKHGIYCFGNSQPLQIVELFDYQSNKVLERKAIKAAAGEAQSAP